MEPTTETYRNILEWAVRVGWTDRGKLARYGTVFMLPVGVFVFAAAAAAVVAVFHAGTAAWRTVTA